MSVAEPPVPAGRITQPGRSTDVDVDGRRHEQRNATGFRCDVVLPELRVSAAPAAFSSPDMAGVLIVNRSAATAQVGDYPGAVSSKRVPGGVVHELPADLRDALIANSTALAAWKDITPLARNEFICWVEDAKQQMTRKRRIRRTQEELEEGQRRPCCWPGCKHRERTGRVSAPAG